MPRVEHLFVEQFGSFVGKYSERIIVTVKGERVQQAPLLYLQSVTIASDGVSISSDTVSACCERGIPIFFVNGYGSSVASLYAAGLNGTILTRREQLRAYDDKRGVHLGCAFAAGKIENQAVTLKYFAKNRRDTPVGKRLIDASAAVRDHIALIDRATSAQRIEDVRELLMAAEGGGARVYWDAVREIVPEQYGWKNRETRGATDPVNSLLNYGYGILRSQVERAVMYAGLDPFGGYVHADRPGKPSLALDLIEEFRQTAVDRVVVGLVNRQFTVEQDDQGMLSLDTRRTYAGHIQAHLQTSVRYHGQQIRLAHVIQSQAREIAAYVRGDRLTYEPYKAGW
ncbi:CRISPR-associated endonuclease Cas1 [Anaerolineae bacterium CFX9]|jgi:CRISPR-associated protein Cas1|nr:CRISPR-associated endonuclease Cas1 [Anaerolineae bacterium CFX9]